MEKVNNGIDKRAEKGASRLNPMQRIMTILSLRAIMFLLSVFGAHVKPLQQVHKSLCEVWVNIVSQGVYDKYLIDGLSNTEWYLHCNY